ncbi:MAG: radical SAM protein [Xanthobacteraceae bacterium]
MAGWTFTQTDIAEARRGERLLNPSIDLSNPCNLNCAYCFIEEKNSPRKVRFPDELSLEETLSVIDDFATAGARSVNLVGAGEPTIDPAFQQIIERIGLKGMTPVVFTNGIHFNTHPELLDILYAIGATVVVKFNSADPTLQDLLAGRKGYTVQRDTAIERLIYRGFAAHSPTRLAFDIIAMQGVFGEITDIVRRCRRENILPIVTNFIPTGRTERGTFVGFAALAALGQHERDKVRAALQPLTPSEQNALYHALADIDRADFEIGHEELDPVV